jgi:collagenase-like PrtC family protease
MRFAHYSPELLKRGVERHRIEGVSVPIFSVAKTVADLFRYRRTVGLTVAIEGLREAIRQRSARNQRQWQLHDQLECWRWRRKRV